VQEDTKAIQLLISGTNEIISHLQIHYLPSFHFFSFFHNGPIQGFFSWVCGFKSWGNFSKILVFNLFCWVYTKKYSYINFFLQLLCHNIEKIRLKRNIGTHAIAKIKTSSFSTTIMKTLYFSSLSPQTMKQCKANKLVDNHSWTVKHWQKKFLYIWTAAPCPAEFLFVKNGTTFWKAKCPFSIFFLHVIPCI